MATQGGSPLPSEGARCGRAPSRAGWCRCIGLPRLVVLAVLATGGGFPVGRGAVPPRLDGAASAGPARTMDWDAADQVAGWYSYTTTGLLGEPPQWHPSQGVDDTGFVSWDLENLRDWPRGVWAFYPLYTMGWTNYGGAHPVNLLLTPMISVALNPGPASPAGEPGPMPVDLQGGEVRFWIAEWNSRTNNAVYSYRRAAFAVGTGGWTRSSVTVTADPDAWEVHSLVGAPQALPEILAHPQQWGFAIVGATPNQRPVGRLGVDALRVARRLRSEDWNTQDALAGWYGDPQAPAWMPEGGTDGTGFLVGALGPATDVRYPLWTQGSGDDGALHPVNLSGNNVLELRIHAEPPVPGGIGTSGRANLGGGVLRVFAGRRVNEHRQTYYRYQRQTLEIGSGDWRMNRVVLTDSPDDWEAYAVVGDAPIPLREILADPQAWGIGWFGATSGSFGRLGFDRLTVLARAHSWDRETEAADWRVGGGPAGGGRPPAWNPAGGSGGTGYLSVPLAEATGWPDRPGAPYFVLSTTSERRWANLHEKRRVTVRLNRGPTADDGEAGLGGGRLTVFVGRWEDPDRYAYYFYKNGLPVSGVGGWSGHELEFTTDPDDWLVLDSLPDPRAIPEVSMPGRLHFPLVPLLQNPRHWGLAVVDADGPLSGWLGFDELEMRPPEVPSPRLEVRRGPGQVELSWRVPEGFGVELQSASLLAGGAGWVLRQVWDDDVFSPSTTWRGARAVSGGRGLSGAWSVPARHRAEFFRVYRPRPGP